MKPTHQIQVTQSHINHGYLCINHRGYAHLSKCNTCPVSQAMHSFLEIKPQTNHMDYRLLHTLPEHISIDGDVFGTPHGKRFYHSEGLSRWIQYFDLWKNSGPQRTMESAPKPIAIDLDIDGLLMKLSTEDAYKAH